MGFGHCAQSCVDTNSTELTLIPFPSCFPLYLHEELGNPSVA